MTAPDQVTLWRCKTCGKIEDYFFYCTRHRDLSDEQRKSEPAVYVPLSALEAAQADAERLRSALSEVISPEEIATRLNGEAVTCARCGRPWTGIGKRLHANVDVCSFCRDEMQRGLAAQACIAELERVSEGTISELVNLIPKICSDCLAGVDLHKQEVRAAGVVTGTAWIHSYGADDWDTCDSWVIHARVAELRAALGPDGEQRKGG